MTRTRKIAIVAAVGLAGALSAPAALAAPTTADSVQGTGTTQSSQSSTNSVSPVAYADRTVREFGVGDDIDLQRDTTSAARADLIDHATAAKHWKRLDAEGTAGHVYVTYVNTETDAQMTLGVKTSTNMHGEHLVDQVS